MPQKDINDFFRPINLRMEISDYNYDKIELCVAMARLWLVTQTTVYISSCQRTFKQGDRRNSLY